MVKIFVFKTKDKGSSPFFPDYFNIYGDSLIRLKYHFVMMSYAGSSPVPREIVNFALVA